MPTSARKSSISAARRGPQKAHVPYRGDNPEVGKKTGIAVKHVERKSDGFERFEDIMQQADNRPPPKPQARKKKKQSLALPMDALDDDDYGEMSMELDDSPRGYFANSHQAITPAANRNGSSSRPVTRTSDIDFDHIPSPRSRGSPRKSNTSGPGPSRLLNTFNAANFDQDSDDDYGEPAYGDDGVYDDQPGGSGEHDSPHGTSFMEMDQDDDDEEQGEEVYNGAPEDAPEDATPSPPTRRDKGKGRAPLAVVPEEDESDIEDEIAKGLEDVQEQYHSDGDDEPEPPKRVKKTKFAEEPKKSQARPKSRSKKENRPYREGIRKSTRERYGPLEYWRGEKLVYGRNVESGGAQVLVPPIKEIVRIPREEPEPLGKRKRTTRARSKSKAEDVHIKLVPVDNPEAGWDDKTDPYCVVLDYESQEEVQRRVVYTASMLNPQKVPSDDWLFQKVFGDADFIAAGVLVLPPKCKKPTKQTKDNTYIFYVVEGAINLKVHETSLVLASGAMFIVPRGNSYFMENVSERDARLFFAQARRVFEDNSGGSHIAPPRRPSVSAGKPLPRSSSAGAAQSETRTGSKAPAAKLRAQTLAA